MALLTRFRILVAILMAFLVAACGGGGGAGTDEDGTEQAGGETESLVAISGSSVDFIALVPLAAWEILEEEEGIVVEQRFVEEASTALQAMEQGDAQIGTNIGVNVGVPAVDAGASVVDVVATQRPTWTLAVRPEIESFADLDGKRMAVHGETSFTRAVSQWFAQENGYEYKELIIPGSEVRAEALAKGQIDGSVIDLPDVVTLGHTYPDEFKILATIGEEFPDLIEQDIWLDRDWAGENRETAVKVVKAVIQACRKLTEDQDYALALAKEHLPDVPEEALQDLVAEYSERGLWPDDGHLTPERATTTLEFFNEVGEIEIEGGEVTDEMLDEYFDFTYVEQAREELDS